MRLMCVAAPLPMEVLRSKLSPCLRDDHIPPFDVFFADLAEGLRGMQAGPLQQRLGVLADFVAEAAAGAGMRGESLAALATAGTLVLAGLSAPTTTAAAAASVFSVLVQQLCAGEPEHGRLRCVDEAHRVLEGGEEPVLKSARHAPRRAARGGRRALETARELLELASSWSRTASTASAGWARCRRLPAVMRGRRSVGARRVRSRLAVRAARAALVTCVPSRRAAVTDRDGRRSQAREPDQARLAIGARRASPQRDASDGAAVADVRQPRPARRPPATRRSSASASAGAARRAQMAAVAAPPTFA
jgi:hypothetical protein